MSSSTKKQQRGGLDLLSNLPDPLLIHILSFVPSVCAVQTCVLSRRWSRLWAFVPTLDVDDVDFGGRQFRVFVTSALLLRENQPIRSLKLCSSRHPCSPNWLLHALRRGLQMLHIEYRPFDEEGKAKSLRLPRSLFATSSLEEIHLDLANTRLPWPAASSLVSLKKLYLCRVRLMTTAPCLISSCCPALEDWTMTGCLLPHTLVVSCPRLQHFGLSCCQGTSKLIVLGERLLKFSALNCFLSDKPGPELFRISSPSLRSFEWDSRAVKRFNISNLNSLVFASVNLHGANDFVGKLDAHNFLEQLKQLMRGLSKAAKLQVRKLPLEALGYREEFHEGLTPNLYGDLVILELDCEFYEQDLLGMSSLLRCCPNLNTLVVTNSTGGMPTSRSPLSTQLRNHHSSPNDLLGGRSPLPWDYNGEGFWRGQNLPLEQLRTVEIREFMVSEEEIYFIFYLLDLAKSLTKITVIPDMRSFSSGMARRTARRLLEMQKNPKIDVAFQEDGYMAYDDIIDMMHDSLSRNNKN